MEACISGGVDVVRNYAISFAKEECKSVWYLKDDIVRISQEVDTFIQDQGALMEAAEKKQLQDEGVRNWVRDLKNVRYDLEDARCDYDVVVSVEDGQGALTRCMRLVCGIPLSCLGVISDPVIPRIEIAHRLKSINKNLVEINQRKARLSLVCEVKVGEGDKSDPPGPSMWQYDEWPMIGRTETKDLIKDELLKYAGSKGSWSKLFVIGIVGAGGMGKTTLAHNIFNDEDVVKAFPENNKWLYVGEKFEPKRVMNEIIGHSNQLVSEDALHKAMREKFKDQSLLIVLDDVWCDTSKEWELLHSSLSKGDKAHALIVTTRNKAVASAIRHDSKYLEEELAGLPFTECMDIFERGAFMGDGAERHRDDLEGLSKRVVQKLKGNPLAATMMGTFLHKHLGNRQKWLDVVKDWPQTDEGDVVDRVVGLSYFHLKPDLKSCFAYCALFPKGDIFDKETLVRMWIAQGYVRPDTSRWRLMEHSGSDHFDDLFQRSFFQRHDLYDGYYRMHDLIHDFAQKVFTEGCRMDASDTEDGTSSEEIRHLSFSYNGTDLRKLERLDKFKKLRTLMLKYSVPLLNANAAPQLDVLAKFKYLRLLVLHAFELSEFPDSIRHLKFLRYLDISGTEIEALPEFVCDLVELQCLKLPSDCALPEGMNKLISLRFIEVGDDDEFPQFKGIGQLTSLQGGRLEFKVEDKSGWKISELKGLNHLHGRLVVRGLQNVTGTKEAEQACLAQKEYLEELVLDWNVEEKEEENVEVSELDLTEEEEESVQEEHDVVDGQVHQHVRNDDVEGQVLEGLIPPQNLEALCIYGNRGARSPCWMQEHGRPPISSTLVKLKLVGCCKWECLPTLGRWPCLRELTIRGAHGVKKIGPEFFYGRGNNNYDEGRSYFPRLEKLKLKDMSLWEEWEMPEAAGEIDSSGGGGGRRHVFPSLKEFRIKKCPKLHYLSPVLRQLTNLETVKIRSCAELASTSLPSRLKKIEILKCPKLTSHAPFLLRHSTDLETLDIRGCAEEEEGADGRGWMLPSRLMKLSKCAEEGDDDERGWMLPSGLKELTVGGSSSWKLLLSLSHLTALQNLRISGFPNPRCIPPGVLHSLRSLEELDICDCPAIESLPDGGLPPSLKTLYIFRCPLLEERCREGGADRPKIPATTQVVF